MSGAAEVRGMRLEAARCGSGWRRRRACRRRDGGKCRHLSARRACRLVEWSPGGRSGSGRSGLRLLRSAEHGLHACRIQQACDSRACCAAVSGNGVRGRVGSFV